MAQYALTIFLSAFLLFQVQPLIGKQILPWFGGTPAVWTTCMLFFQVLLLAGYAYAHLLANRVPARRQGFYHLALLLVSLIFLPIIPEMVWKPTGAESPTWRILALLAVTIGMPYFLLSSTGPLLQEAFRRNVGRTPYRLYALSNVGSLLALVSYPFVFEPELTLKSQQWTWSIAYVLFVICCGWCAVQFHRRGAAVEVPALDRSPSDLTPADQASAVRPRGRELLLWLALSACGSVMLLATTNQVCQEVAVVPFLWVVPLAIYLLTFIICFEKESWYVRRRFIPYLATAAVLSCIALGFGNSMHLWVQLGIYLGTLAIACMVCHGELVNVKPHPRFLTLFYLVISAGGALGGMLVALGAPRWFAGFWEYPIGLVATCVLAVIAAQRLPQSAAPRVVTRWRTLVTASCILGLVATLAVQAYAKAYGSLEIARNFYGLLRVSRDKDEVGEKYLMTHGQIEHGFQYLDSEKRRWPTAYYGPQSGVGIALANHPRRAKAQANEQTLRIGVVGLGCGTIAAHGRPGDYLRFYEINPEVLRMCDEYFTFCHDTPAKVEFVLGDARVKMEQEADQVQFQRFDVLAIDAFSSDSIPMHLLTRECVALYRQHLQPDGLLCLHLSNRYLDLTGVARGLAAEFGYEAVLFNADGIKKTGTSDSTWVVLTKNREFLDSPTVTAAATPWPHDGSRPLVWTDDYGSLRQVLAR